MREHGSILLYVHGNQKARKVGKPRLATSTFTQLLSSENRYDSPVAYIPYISGTLGDAGVHRHKTE